MTAPLPGIRPGQIWMSRQPRKRGRYERIEVTGGGMGDVYANTLDDNGHPVGENRSLPCEGFEERYRLVSEPGVVTEDG